MALDQRLFPFCRRLLVVRGHGDLPNRVQARRERGNGLHRDSALHRAHGLVLSDVAETSPKGWSASRSLMEEL